MGFLVDSGWDFASKSVTFTTHWNGQKMLDLFCPFGAKKDTIIFFPRSIQIVWENGHFDVEFYILFGWCLFGPFWAQKEWHPLYVNVSLLGLNLTSNLVEMLLLLKGLCLSLGCHSSGFFFVFRESMLWLFVTIKIHESVHLGWK